jgi:hypothetical protein
MVLRMNAAKTSGVAVQEVNAPAEYALAQIRDGEAYVGKVPGLSSVKNDAEKKRGDGSVATKATYIVKIAMGYQLEYYIDQVYSPKQRCLTWTLDYSRKSDLHDSVGYWRVDLLPDRPDRCRVFYSSSSLVKGMPQFVMDILTSQALKASTAWVKKYAEIEYAKVAPKQAPTTGAAAGAKASGPGGASARKPLSWRCAFVLSYEDVVGQSAVDECLSESGMEAGASHAHDSRASGTASRASSGSADADGATPWFNLILISSMLMLYCSSPYSMFLVVAC